MESKIVYQFALYNKEGYVNGHDHDTIEELLDVVKRYLGGNDFDNVEFRIQKVRITYDDADPKFCRREELGTSKKWIAKR